MDEEYEDYEGADEGAEAMPPQPTPPPAQAAPPTPATTSKGGAAPKDGSEAKEGGGAAAPPPAMAAPVSGWPTSSEAATFSSTSFVSLLLGTLGQQPPFAFTDPHLPPAPGTGIQALRELLSLALRFDMADPLDTDFRKTALLDTYAEVVDFAFAERLSTRQTQQLLLLYHDIMLDVASPHHGGGGAPGHAGDGGGEAALFQRSLVSFHLKLSKLCARRTDVPVDERRTVEETILEEIPDPAFLAALAAEQAAAASKKGGKKSQAATDASSAVTIPKITVSRQRQQTVVQRQHITIDPSFSPPQMGRITEFFSTTVFQHWNLFRLVSLSTGQATEDKWITVGIEDLPSKHVLPPLSAAVTLAEKHRSTQQQQLKDEALRAIEAEFDTASLEIQVAAASHLATIDAAWEQHGRDVARDLADGMSYPEYDRTVQALTTALSASVKRGQQEHALPKRLERLEAAAAAGPPPPNRAGEAAASAAKPGATSKR
mgnify:CR=1 FL=1